MEDRITIRFQNQIEEISAAAKEREVSGSKFVREAVHDHIHSDRLPKRDDLEWIKFLLGKHYENQTRVGNNLNQLVLRFHEIKVLDPDSLRALLQEALDVFKVLSTKLDEVEARFDMI